jgi:hypothetical protein
MPISAKTLLDRIVSILPKSRPAVAPGGDRGQDSSELFAI